MIVLRPNGDIQTTGWSSSTSAANLFEDIDEDKSDGDTSYIYTTSTGSGNEAIFQLEDCFDPGGQLAHRLWISYYIASSTSMYVRIYQGTTLVKSQLVFGTTTGAWTQTAVTLSDAQEELLTNYDEVRVGIYMNSGSELRISWMQFQIGDNENYTASVEHTVTFTDEEDRGGSIYQDRSPYDQTVYFTDEIDYQVEFPRSIGQTVIFTQDARGGYFYAQTINQTITFTDENLAPYVIEQTITFNQNIVATDSKIIAQSLVFTQSVSTESQFMRTISQTITFTQHFYVRIIGISFQGGGGTMLGGEDPSKYAGETTPGYDVDLGRLQFK